MSSLAVIGTIVAVATLAADDDRDRRSLVERLAGAVGQGDPAAARFIDQDARFDLGFLGGQSTPAELIGVLAGCALSDVSIAEEAPAQEVSVIRAQWNCTARSGISRRILTIDFEVGSTIAGGEGTFADVVL